MLRIGIACLFILVACTGCEFFTLAAAGTAVSIAGTAVTTGPEVFQAGKLDTAFMASLDRCHNAVEMAGADLHLRQVRNLDKGNGKWEFQFQDDFNSKIEVTLEKRAQKLCLCQVNVGLFGSRVTAELIMSRIEAHLPPPATIPIER
jgi:hypothetical protein